MTRLSSRCALFALVALSALLAVAQAKVEVPELLRDDADLAGRTNLLFRALDADRDKRVSAADVAKSAAVLEKHLPGVTAEQFNSFIQMGDTNKDGSLDQQEFLNAFAQGVRESREESQSNQNQQQQQQQQKPADASMANFRFAEARSMTAQTATAAGINRPFRKFADKMNAGTRAWIKAYGTVDRSQDSCVMCQYYVERVEANLRFSGLVIADTLPTVASPAVGGVVLTPSIPLPVVTPAVGLPIPTVATAVAVPAMPLTPLAAVLGAHAMPSPFVGMVEEQSKATLQPSFVEAEATGSAPPGRLSGLSPRAKAQQTRVIKAVNRVKYAQVQKIMDVTMDDVCERGTPSTYYGYCKHLFKVEKDVVEGLVHMFHATDICLRVGMCGRKSYITMGMHTRFK